MGIHRINQFFSSMDLIPLAVPVNLATAANPGDRINISEYHGCLLTLFKAIGTAGEDPVITVQQHDAATGGNSKALNISNNIYTRISATDVGTVTAWTNVSQAAGATYTNTDAAEAQGMIAVDILNEDLDTANGYKYISLLIPDVGTNSQLGGTFALLYGKRYEGTLTNVLV